MKNKMLRSQFSSFKHHVDNFVENSVFLFLQLPKTLDVYKRQIRLELPRGDSPYEEAGKTLEEWLQEGILKQDMEAVSYTHLDVYKRQEFHNTVGISIEVTVLHLEHRFSAVLHFLGIQYGDGDQLLVEGLIGIVIADFLACA